MQKEIKYLTIEEQIENLTAKGLLIKSKKTARKYLCDIGYYKLINGYKKPFMFKQKNEDGTIIKKYYENTSIEDLFHLYEFDQNIKGLILKYISFIEVKVKSRMSDVLSQKFGIKEKEYLSVENFKPDSTSNKHKNNKKFLEIQKEIIDTIEHQKTKHPAIKWYSNNYNFYPFWVISNILTLGTISLLYGKMRQAEQNEISRTFGVKSKLFESMLMIMQLFRNACAHNEVIYNYKAYRSLSQNDIKPIYDACKIEVNSKTGRYSKGVNDVFALIIIFKVLLSKEKFANFLSQFNSALNSLNKKIDTQKFQEILLAMGIVEDLSILKNL